MIKNLSSFIGGGLMKSVIAMKMKKEITPVIIVKRLAQHGKNTWKEREINEYNSSVRALHGGECDSVNYQKHLDCQRREV